MGVKIKNPNALQPIPLDAGFGLTLAIQVIATMGKPQLDKLINGIGKNAAPLIVTIKESCETWLKKKKVK